VRSPLEPDIEFNLSGYRSPTRGDRRVVLYAARPTVWLAYNKRIFFNEINWFHEKFYAFL